MQTPYNSPLFERENLDNPEKLCFLVRRAFVLNDGFEKQKLKDPYISFSQNLQIPANLSEFAFSVPLLNCLDFKSAKFNKAINLNVANNENGVNLNPFEGSKFDLVKLGYVGEFFMGGTPSRKNLNYWQGGNIKWLTIGDYENFSIITDTKEKITDLGLQNSSAKLIKKGAVVVSIYATIGRVGILGDDMATNQAIVSICVNNNFINKFVMYMIGFCNSQLINIAKTITQQNINLEILKSIFIPLPPLEAQEKIVKSIEFCEDKILNLNNELKTLENATSKILKRELF
ncbi:hypothetical protein HHI31_04620 [Campylobacter fetus subsp. venerealis]|uniref:restriction endonuclease subunit S n=1 Tax=Campylobacter fetus TaxID=196 RepID=UPI0018E7C6F3|nr:restriction endonuclease subunit S [Campylobacter fetus]QQF52143.1 hypothetical protein HHI31_04620 [Campylobacter fetus subsp. venerealis]